MDPVSAAIIIGATAQAGGALFAGISAKNEAKLTAFGIETERVQNKAAASQMAQARRAEYDAATSANIAAFSAAGRDIGSDRSVKAFLDKQKEIMGEDIGRIQTQTRAEDLAAIQRAFAVRREGKQALVASLFEATAAAASGASQYSKTKTPTQTPTPGQGMGSKTSYKKTW
jgi:hypothetical protein